MSIIQERDAMTEAEVIAKRDALLLQWQKHHTQLQALKESEMESRKLFIDFISDASKKKGTENIELGNGYKAKIVKGQRQTLNQDLINATLDKIEQIGGAEGRVIANRLVKWKGELSKTEYDSLEPQYRGIIDTIITTTDSSPTLEIIAPKAKKVL